MEMPHRVVQKHWQKDAGHLPGSLSSTPPQGAWLPCRPPHPGGAAPLPPHNSAPRGPGSPAVHRAQGSGSPAAHHIQGPQLPFSPPRPRGAQPPAVWKAKPHWAPSPAAGALPALSRRAWGDPPWALPFILPLPRLVPETPAPPHACFPSPDGATAREPPSTFTHGEQPRASPQGRPPGVSSHRRPSHDATLRWR